jgi:type IV secretory pathway VirB4 component
VFRLSQISKDYKDAAPLCEQINLFGFVDDEIFLTKSGDFGVVMSLGGVDYECLDMNAIDNLTRRLAAAFRIFDEKCRLYQYLFKRNRESFPSQCYQNPVVNAAIENRIAYLRAKAESLYSFHIYYIVLYEGFRYQTSIVESLAKLSSEPREALRELSAFLSTPNQVVLIDNEIERACAALRAKAHSFQLQVGDFVSTHIVAKEEAFRVLKQILNFSPLKIAKAQLKCDTFLDYYYISVNLILSAIEVSSVWTTSM